MADLEFDKARISGVVTTVGGRQILIDDEAPALGMSESDLDRLKRAFGLRSRYVVSDPATTTSDLCIASVSRLLDGLGLKASEIDALIMVTQTPDYAAPATAISMQHKLGMRIETMAFDLRLGCSGFVYGLALASSLVQSGLSRVLLCVGDVASRMVPPADHTITPLMGDAGSAIMVERGEARSVFQLYSDGSGEKGLYIPNSGLKVDPDDVERPRHMIMDGGAVFNFTLKRVPAMVIGILERAAWDMGSVDRFVLHQPNKYILGNIQKRLGIGEDRLPSVTQSNYGNQNSASIPGTMSGYLNDLYSSSSTRTVFAGFGIGLSWAAAAVETSPMFCPAVMLYEDVK